MKETFLENEKLFNGPEAQDAVLSRYLPTIGAGVVAEAERRTYRDNPVIVALKCLHELRWITEDFRALTQPGAQPGSPQIL